MGGGKIHFISLGYALFFHLCIFANGERLRKQKKKIKLLNCVPVFIQAGESENLEIVLRYFVSVP